MDIRKYDVYMSVYRCNLERNIHTYMAAYVHISKQIYYFYLLVKII